MNQYIKLHPLTKDVKSALCSNSLFILSSRFEGFGMVITEAMACGLPTVAFNCHYGPSDIIKDKEDGLLAKPENIKDLTEKICLLIENEKMRKEMGIKAYENIKRYHISNIGKIWNEMFFSLICK